jgi:hypothetical protein
MPIDNLDNVPEPPWCDALGHRLDHSPLMIPLGTYMPKMFSLDDLDQCCTLCGKPVREHVVGGPGPYHPIERTPLWMWD